MRRSICSSTDSRLSMAASRAYSSRSEGAICLLCTSGFISRHNSLYKLYTLLTWNHSNDGRWTPLVCLWEKTSKPRKVNNVKTEERPVSFIHFTSFTPFWHGTTPMVGSRFFMGVCSDKWVNLVKWVMWNPLSFIHFTSFIPFLAWSTLGDGGSTLRLCS